MPHISSSHPITAAAAALAALALAGIASAAAPAPASSSRHPTKPPTYLYAHDSAAGTFTAVKGSAGTFRLALSGVQRTALYFSDRPQRVVGAEPLGRMLAGFFAKPGVVHPNAAVSALDPATGQTVLMGVELLRSAYDWKRRTLVYTVKRLQEGARPARLSGRTDVLLPARLGKTSVFIDDYGHNSCQVTLNDASHDWTLISSTLNNSNDTWGITNSWDEQAPGSPSSWGTSEGTTSITYGSISGFDRGCGNTAMFLDKAAGVVLTVTASDPYSGSNSYSCTFTDPRFSCGDAYGVLGGDQLYAQWTIQGP